MRRPVVCVLLILLAPLFGLGTTSLVAQETEAEKASAPADSVPPELTRARELMGALEGAIDSILVLESRLKGADSERRQVIRVLGQQQVELINDNQVKLLDLLPELAPQ